MSFQWTNSYPDLPVPFVKKPIFAYGRCMLNHVQLFSTPWTVAHQAPLSMEFSRNIKGNTGVCWHFLLQGIFPTEVYSSQQKNPKGWDWPIILCISCIARRILYHLHHLGSPIFEYWVLLSILDPLHFHKIFLISFSIYISKRLLGFWLEFFKSIDQFWENWHLNVIKSHDMCTVYLKQQKSYLSHL